MRRFHIVTVCTAAGIAGTIILLRSHARLQAPAFAQQQLAAPAPSSAPPTPPALNKAEYDAKLLELANRSASPCSPAPSVASHRAPRRTKRLVAAGGGRRKEPKRPKVLRRPCAPPLWPVHAVYPNAGALLPFNRIVAYYGNFYSHKMGILGQYPQAEVIARLKAQAAAWAKADPSTPVLLGLDYIAVSAQGSPGRSGEYRMRMPADQIQKAIQMANQIHGVLFLDVQPGWSSVQREVPLLAPYLQLPNVELALDPEFALIKGRRPGVYRGTMSAADINFAAKYLAGIVDKYHLPPKILMVHRFTRKMVTGSRAIHPLPQVEVVMDMDGFGSPRLKSAAYLSFIERKPVQFTGFKLFYKNDVHYGRHLMTPEEVLRLAPRPSVILYQ